MRKMKKTSFVLFLTTIVLLFLFVDLSSQQTAEELFEKALYTEEAQGDLQKAIGLYEQILKQFPDNREIAAKAQLHIGLCYEKLGLQEAPKAYQKVLDDFPEQKEAVKIAQEKLSVFLKAKAAIEKVDKEFNIRKVWAGPGTDILGAPSPDGKYLSFVDWITGDLAIRDLATGKNRRLTDKGSWVESSEFALFSKWSPDGKKIVYNWCDNDGLFDLRIVGIENPEPKILYSEKEMGYVQPFEWSPDGNSILAIVAYGPDVMQLGLFSVADGSFHVLKDISEREWFGYPPLITFSPDGKYVAYDYPQDEDTQKRDIFVMSVYDNFENRLISHPMNETLLGWTPDGKWIFFVSNRTGARDAWIAGIDKGELKQSSEMVKKEIGFIHPLGFTQKGHFYFGIDNAMNDIYSIRIDSDTGKILSSPKKATLNYEGSNRTPAYSANGKYIAYVSTRGLGPLRHRVLCIRDVQTGKERELKPELDRFAYPRWSPDGRFISVEREYGNNQFGIYLIDTQTGAVNLVVQVDPEVVIYSHRWSRDGKTIFYTGSEPEAKVQNALRTSHIYVHDIESGRDMILPGSPADAKDIDISPDGKWLVLLNRDDERVLRVIPTSGGVPRTLYSFKQMPSLITSPTWIAGGKYILFYLDKTVSDPSRTLELVRIPAEGGELEELGLEMMEFRHFSAHPDGQHIVFHSRGSTMRWPEVWVMENFLPKKK
jgi:Tol biopolymer transport system component